MQAKTSLDEQADDNAPGFGGKSGPPAEVSRHSRRREPCATEQDLASAQARFQSRPGTDGDWHSHQCHLATPMYGGGVHAGKLDHAMPIRAASIRGQLRFWWRIAFGDRKDSRDTFKREAAIWGGIGHAGPTASQVRIRVVQSGPVESQPAPSKDALGYAFGPAMIGNTEQKQLLTANYKFDLQLRYPRNVEADVEETLWWWASFGGIGARTRRGFGAVRSDTIAPRSALKTIETVRRAGGELCFGTNADNSAVGAWKHAVDKLRRFRQQGLGRLDANPPGHSYWPEADQIRRFTRRNAHHRHDTLHAAENVFPRAAFGLPINFQFKDKNRGDPGDTVLLPAGTADRMASPLILRPYWTGEAWVAAALLLPGWQHALDQPLRFNSGSGSPKHWPKDEDRRAALAQLIAPMKTAGGSLRGTDPLSAFMQFFAEKP